MIYTLAKIPSKKEIFGRIGLAATPILQPGRGKGSQVRVIGFVHGIKIELHLGRSSGL